ncbi:hypothetical protein BDA99DRAFT_509191 [Phascolomyces articulosus]|uniref:HMG box domain-containing protein n=1 Tax=Phascolomyces articulosus TaxID=60185 RepID=A0AAD5KF29_9FUNG|nr:hypothetical protein BDA99DRAFT_509191 [Phascolomyces articulosus]
MQRQRDDENNTVSYNPDDPGHFQVKELLIQCKLLQYLDKFLNEGFDSLKSFCEVSEDDMIVMKVKRGHRRLIQREIATLRGIPRHEPLYINRMGTVTTSPKVPLLSQATANTTSSSDSSSGTTTGGNTSRQDASAGSSGTTSGNITSATTQSSEVTSQLHQQKISATAATTSSSISSQQEQSTNKQHYHHHHHHYHHRSTIRTIGDLPSNKGSGDSSNDDSGAARGHTIALNSDYQQSLLPPKRRYRRHPKPDRNAPIKPPSAYVMFSNDLRNELKDQNLTFAQLAKIAGERWKTLSVAGKNQYESTAVEAKNAYIISLSQYRQTTEFKRYQEYLNDFRIKHGSHRAVGGDRKRFKSASGSPGSGSMADSSSNGNSSNGLGSSSGSSGGSADGNSYESGNGSNNDATTSVGQQQQAGKLSSTTTAEEDDDPAVLYRTIRFPVGYNHQIRIRDDDYRSRRNYPR